MLKTTTYYVCTKASIRNLAIICWIIGVFTGLPIGIVFGIGL